MTAYEPIHAVHRLDTRRTYTPPTTDTYSDGIDWIAVERATRGELPKHPLTHDELREASLWLIRAGTSRKAVSARLSVYERLIKEWEAGAGLLGPEDLCTTPDCTRARSGRNLCALCLNAVRVQERRQKTAAAEAMEIAA